MRGTAPRDRRNSPASAAPDEDVVSRLQQNLQRGCFDGAHLLEGGAVGAVVPARRKTLLALGTSTTLSGRITKQVRWMNPL